MQRIERILGQLHKTNCQAIRHTNSRAYGLSWGCASKDSTRRTPKVQLQLQSLL